MEKKKILYILGAAVLLFFQTAIFVQACKANIAVKVVNDNLVQKTAELKADINYLKEVQEHFSVFAEEKTAAAEDARNGIAREVKSANAKIKNIDVVYSAILNEQKKKTLEALYDDNYLADEMKRAKDFFDRGKFENANALYAIVFERQPENKDAKFFMYYTLFLKNMGDSGSYGKIQNGFYQLEREGYVRKEMKEVLKYIGDENVQ